MRSPIVTGNFHDVEPALEEILNLLLESERAGVVALDSLASLVENDELKRLLTTSREDEGATVRELEDLIRTEGRIPSQRIGPFAAKVASAGTLSQQLKLLIHGEEWVARKVEEALALAPASGAFAIICRKWLGATALKSNGVVPS